MDFREKVEQIKEKVRSYEMAVEGGEKIPEDEMVRIMLEGGQIFEPCIILGENDCFIDFMVVDLEKGPVFSFSIVKRIIAAFGTFHKPLDELCKSEEEINAVPASLYM